MGESDLTDQQSLRWVVNWDGSALAYAGFADGQLRPASGFSLVDVPVADGAPVPEGVENNIPAEMLLWPVEQLLVRPFELPLKSPNLLDHEILMQEAEEQAGDDAGDYWFAWHASVCANGVRGMLFGLPESVRQALQARPDWQHCAAVTPDAWVRLTARVTADFDAVAVMDEDSEGMFVGLYDGGSWLGMRRINKTAWKTDVDLLDDAIRSLQAMGMSDKTSMTGRLSESLTGMLNGRDVAWRGETGADDMLPGRQEANLDAAARVPRDGELNFRHGSWRKRESGQLYRWRHTFVLAAVVVTAMIVGGLWQIHSLGARADAYRDEIEAAFHQGLPAEKVMLDPLGQLRMAAGRAASPKSGNDFLRQLALVAKAKQSVSGWDVREIGYDDEGVKLFGMAADFAMVNRIRDALASAGAGDVHVEDTEAEGKQVRFRMRWTAP